MTEHQHYGVLCTIVNCGPRKPLRHYAPWGAEEIEALLAAEDLVEFATAWKRDFWAARRRRFEIRASARRAPALAGGDGAVEA